MERFVKIVEVGPRDGLQNEKTILDVTTKIKFIDLLSDSGLSSIEVGSFVSKDWIPQMSDTDQIFDKIIKKPQINYSVLVPNDVGLNEAIEANVDSIAIFAAASESFSKKNINCSIDESFRRFETVTKTSISKNIPVRGYISCVLGCPYEGAVDINKVTAIAKRLINLGCYEISLGDTIGVGSVTQVQELIDKISNEIEISKVAVHFHDTYGQALVNVYAALEMGVNTIDSAVAGLGGCPYAKGASGNLATEDLIYMLQGLKIKTNVDLNKIVDAGHYIAKKLNITPRSKISLLNWK